MSKHHHRNNNRPVNNGFNLGNLLGNIDLPQLLSLMSAFGGGGMGGMMSNDKISSLLNNMNTGDITRNIGGNNFNESNIKSQLAALENRLENLENRSDLQNQVLAKIKELQNSPDAAKFLNDFMNSNSKK
ncbi:hypothetical protein H2684_08015 [Clostridium sp. cel8]|jgi:hypothetical protein|uniref:hypothetical protein n=1 Tax=unclassified Clostridium TaxID=2614128 RepID=UPI0015F71855|nr:hypothetical protein [Clostridium sp. cel8]MBA5851250.1 hypothetical protein [Clostridium sp. cel8]